MIQMRKRPVKNSRVPLKFQERFMQLANSVYRTMIAANPRLTRTPLRNRVAMVRDKMLTAACNDADLTTWIAAHQQLIVYRKDIDRCIRFCVPGAYDPHHRSIWADAKGTNPETLRRSAQFTDNLRREGGLPPVAAPLIKKRRAVRLDPTTGKRYVSPETAAWAAEFTKRLRREYGVDQS